MSATPRTDAVDAAADENYGTDMYRDMLEHARQLERDLVPWEWVKDSCRTNADHAVLVKLLPDGNYSFLHGDPSVVAEEKTTLPERVWRDTRTVTTDLIMGHGYSWEGWECVRKELHTDWGSFAIWPDYLGGNSKWNVYHDLDGGYKGDLASRAEAERTALAWLAAVPNDAPSGPHG